MSNPASINLKIDSGATHHFQKIVSTNLPQQPNSNYNQAAQVIVPNWASMVSSTTTHIIIRSLPPSTTKSHCFNYLESVSIFSVGQDCDHYYTAVFEKNSVKIFKYTEVNINALFTPIIQGHRNASQKYLYSVYIPT